MKHQHMRRWYWIHKWSSLICTLFLLILCITGLPLVFHEDITDWNIIGASAAVGPDAPVLSLDTIASAALTRYPNDRITSMFADDDEPKVIVALEAPGSGPHRTHSLVLESHTAALLNDSLAPTPPKVRSLAIRSLMATVLRLHVSLFAAFPGQLFLALMALLFLAALVSGVALYGPFMRKLDFGAVRHGHSARVKWLDLHNLLGIVALGWITVVGVTGLFNELSAPLTGLWQLTTIPKLLAPYRGKPLPTVAEMVSPQAAMDAARQAMPGMITRFIAYPGKVFGTSPQHFVIYARGSTPLTFELIVPVLVDARTGRVERTVRLPWYLQALELSRPLHFGNYGGLPLKVLWAFLDFITIVVLGSGVYLWIARRRSHADRLAHLQPFSESVENDPGNLEKEAI